jgi:glycosyltransferase involved in cell wall biosynthesis
VSRSRAEIGIAKEGYVRSDCGWFSDRSACYLASGRPVLALDTGFSRHLPTGLGLLGFRDLDEAIAGVEAIDREYERHARAAREIAESHLDARVVIARLLQRAGVH